MPVAVFSPATPRYPSAQQYRTCSPTGSGGQLYVGAEAELAGVGVEVAKPDIRAAMRSLEESIVRKVAPSLQGD